MRRSAGRDEGQATVELALVLPVVLVLLLMVVQVAMVLRDQLAVTAAAREGARAAAVDADPAAAERSALSSGALDATRAAVTVSGRAGPGSRVEVSVVYRAPTDVPLVGPMLGDVTLQATAVMRVE